LVIDTIFHGELLPYTGLMKGVQTISIK